MKEQFPKADSALLIKRPDEFINNFEKNPDNKCYSNNVIYYKDNLITKDITNFLIGDKWEVNCENSNEKVGRICDDNVYKIIFLKDDLFKWQQEYRFVLYKKLISNPQIFKFPHIDSGEIFEINKFFDGVKVKL